MDFGDLLIRSSVRIAMLSYAGVLLGCAWGGHAPATTAASRWLWTLGCAVFWGHVLSAFAFYHHWSHEHAFLDTAAKTREAIGLEFGYGIYVNHLFALVWTADVAWSWLAAKSYATRPRWLVVSIHAFLLFIAINGLMVFKSGLVRWVTAAALAVLAGVWGAKLVARGMKLSVADPHDEAARS